MHFVVDNVACSSEVDGVDDLVVAVVLVAVEIFCLAAMSCYCKLGLGFTSFLYAHLSSERTVSRLAARP